MDGSNTRAEAPLMEPSAKLFCCRCVRRCLPLAYREELYHFLRMSGPLVSDFYFMFLHMQEKVLSFLHEIVLVFMHNIECLEKNKMYNDILVSTIIPDLLFGTLFYILLWFI